MISKDKIIDFKTKEIENIENAKRIRIIIAGRPYGRDWDIDGSVDYLTLCPDSKYLENGAAWKRKEELTEDDYSAMYYRTTINILKSWLESNSEYKATITVFGKEYEDCDLRILKPLVD